MADFTGHTPGPWHYDGQYIVQLTEPQDDLDRAVQVHLKGGGVYNMNNPTLFAADGATNADCELAAAAPSLLARAEAAEERVRVLEAALKTVATKLQQAEIVAYQGGSGSKQRVADLINDANCAARAALTTGVQHG